MKKTKGNSGYIGVDKRTSEIGIISQQTAYLERLSGRLSPTVDKRLVTDELVLKLDGKIYAGSGDWLDQSGNGYDFLLGGGPVYSEADFSFQTDSTDDYFRRTTAIVSTSSCTVCFVLKTTDVQGLFVYTASGGGNYLGAYRSGNKEYYGSAGSPAYFQDTIDKSNIYDNVRTGEYIYIEFKGADMDAWTTWNFFGYASYELLCHCRMILVYDKSLSADESTQNYEYLVANGYL